MKSRWFLCSLASLLAVGCASQTPADTRAADENAIRELDAEWSKAASTNDVDASVSYYADDAVLLPPNAPAATTKEAIRAAWAGMLAPGVKVTWQPSKVEVARSGDLAYLWGTYDMTIADAQGKVSTDRGKLVEVWKKQADGKWKTAADIFNSDLPVPAPPAK